MVLFLFERFLLGIGYTEVRSKFDLQKSSEINRTTNEEAIGMAEVMGILYYFIVYFFEYTKFFLVNKYILNWRQKTWSWKRSVAATGGIAGIALFFFYLSEQMNPLACYILFVILETVILFEDITWKKICITLTEMFVIGSLDSMMQQMYVVLLDLLGIHLKWIVKLLVAPTTIFFIACIIYAMRDRMRGYITRIPKQYYILFVCLEIGNGMILGDMKLNLPEGNVTMHIAFIFIVLGVFLELALLMFLAVTREMYKEKDLLNQKYLKWQEDHYKYLEQRETATKKFRHDMRDHIYILQHLLEQGKQEEAEQYVNELEQHFLTVGTAISVNHGIVDAILNKYASECEKKHIALCVKGHMPQNCEISSFDLCVIFSNLLSNAIEGTENCSDKKIHIDLRHEEGIVMLCIENTFDGLLDEKNGKLQTRKVEKEIHGYGLANVRECVGQNQGHMDIRQQDKRFIVTIFLPYEKRTP